MKRMICAALLAGMSMTASAAVSYYACDMQVTFRKPYANNTDWVHVENRYTKYLKLDDAAKMAYLFNDRNGGYAPICSSRNRACAVSWQRESIHIDGTRSADDPLPPYLDFRRSLTLNLGGRPSQLVIADFGDGKLGKPYMTWSYDGVCRPTNTAPEPMKLPGFDGPPPPPSNPNYKVPTQPAMAMSDAERDRVLANYSGNTLTGFSGGGHWFHMWFFDKGLAYSGDDYDMTSEGAPRQWYVGKDATGYRLCPQPIPPEGRANCYPLLIKQIGESWVEHDMDGDAQFTLLKGRQ